MHPSCTFDLGVCDKLSITLYYTFPDSLTNKKILVNDSIPEKRAKIAYLTA